MTIFITILLITAVIIAALSYNGILKDSDKDGIPDEVEEKIEAVKKKVKSKLKK
jgi:hypothetical protein|tara:strand:- start:260 stop:421 length:162 start_codon:yes stop_codon:yes gene_type:complete